jgi:inorganic pyrophosphatase
MQVCTALQPSMDLSTVPASPGPGLVNLLVEIPAGSRNKYEYNEAAGVMALDRVLHSSVRYPFDYGFVPGTLNEDGAPLDALVIMQEPTFAGCLIVARPIGILDMIDSGCHDGKLLCIPLADQRQNAITDLRQIAASQLEEVAEFFRTYKNLEGRLTTITGWLGSDAVPALLERCIKAASAAKSPAR